MDAAQKQRVIDTLDDMIASEGFANATQMQNFLHYVVTTTLDGKSNELKGYTIGVDALGKPSDFDPMTDPSVRVMAGRLRQAIDNYNRESAKPGNPLISLPKGSYVPEIEFPAYDLGMPETGVVRNQQQGFFSGTGVLFVALLALALSAVSLYLYWNTQNTQDLPEPRLLLAEHTSLPVVTYQFTHDATSMPNWISPELASSRALTPLTRFHEYQLIPRDPNRKQIGADYNLSMFFSGSLKPDDLDVFVTLYRAQSEEVVWSERFTFSRTSVDDGSEGLEQVEAIISGLLSPYGILYGDILRRPNPPPRLACVRANYDYFNEERLETYATAFACTREAIELGTAPSSVQALMAFLHVEAFRRSIEGLSNEPLVTAREHANNSIKLNEANARAYQALFAVEKVEGNEVAAIAAAERAMSLNPYDRDIIGDFAAYLVSRGKLEEASKPLERANRLTPSPPAWLQFYNFLHADLTGDYENADRILESSTLEVSPLIAVAKLLAYQRNQNPAFLERAVEVLAVGENGFLDTPEEAFLRRGFSESVAKQLAGRITEVKQLPEFQKQQTLLTN